MRRFLWLALLWLMPGLVAAGDEFKWAPIAAGDWSLKADSTKGIRHALMLFEKVTRDDTGELYELEIYRRFKIFDAEGRKWGDFNIPYVHKKQKVTALRGRTVQADGREFALAPDQIFEKDVIKAKGIKIKQKSFSLPGINDGCIIEYYVKIQSPTAFGNWPIQKSIAQSQWEFVWKFKRLEVSADYLDVARKYFTPNYMWHPLNISLTPILRPSFVKPTEAFFSARNLPAMEEEPFATPEVSRQARLYCYYGPDLEPQAFWKKTSKEFTESMTKYGKKNKRAREIAAGFANANTDEAKIAAAYEWTQKNLKNLSFIESDEDYKDNENLDDTLKRGYGTRLDLNFIFHSLLREMNIEAKLAFVVDRDDGLFLPKAKYWQFDRSMVAVPAGANVYRFISPGEAYLPNTHAPWFSEGVQAFVVNDTMPLFVNVPYSEATTNRTNRVFSLRLKDDLNLEGEMIDLRQGHAGRGLRLALVQATPAEREEKLAATIKDIVVPAVETDSIAVDNLEDIKKSLALKCKLKFANLEQPMGSRLFLKPFSFLSRDENPFQTAKRQHPLMFDYAHELIDVVKIELPENWKLEAMPADTAFANKIGSCAISFSNFGQVLSIQRSFKLKQPYLQPADYALVRKLFQERQLLNEQTLVLKNAGAGAAK
jgi:hypothetical protein